MSNPLAESPSGTTVPQPPLHALRWHDPLIDRLGHDPHSRYVEWFWLGIIGPSTTVLLRVFDDALDEHGGVAHLDLVDVAAQIGVGHRGGRNSPLSRSIQRAMRFGAARPAGADSIEVRHRLAPLNRSQIERLPLSLQAEHQPAGDCRLGSFEGPPPGVESDRMRRRLRRDRMSTRSVVSTRTNRDRGSQLGMGGLSNRSRTRA